jgi:hypothetical protein
MKFSTDEKRTRLLLLRAEGQSMQNSNLGCVSSTISNMLNHPPESQPKKPKASAKPPPINPPRVFRASCPMRRKINTLHRDGQQLTKPEMYDILAAAVRTTASLAR